MEKRKEFIINFVYIICILVIIYAIGKYLLPVVVPFIIGFFIAYFIRKISIVISKKEDKKIQMVLLILFYLLVISTISILSVLFVNQIKNINYGGIYTDYIEPAINIVYNKAIEINNSLPKNISIVISDALSSFVTNLKNLLSTVSVQVVKFIKDVISSVPSVLVTTIAMIVSSIYFVLDYEKLVANAYKLLPKKATGLIDNLIVFIKENIFKVLKAYISIIFITFTELLIGFLIIRIDNAMVLAFLIAIMDILPIVGVGTALIPWFILEFIFGNYMRAIGLVIVYIAITIIRNIIEPKLVGTNLGLPPLLTLVGMIVGLRLFGLVGMIGLPLTFAFLIYLNKKEEKEEQIQTQ
ncbi:MAG: sporulation integral membrane protein YtvI [Erysipelotrichia bacterium]|nr:sporulation integral membrane protein YtvI [Erysipelotrichia bacterium]